MKDPILIAIVLLLTISIGAWLTGWIIYPFGFLVFSVALVVRLVQMITKGK